MNTFSNPIPQLIDGLLQGHELGMRMHRQKQEDEAFKTRQALDNQTLSMKDIMERQREMEGGRPVQNGTVQDQMNMTLPGMPGSTGPTGDEPADIHNLPTRSGPSFAQPINYTRKADSSRTTKRKDLQGNEITTEWYSPEEVQQRSITQETDKSNRLADAAQRHAAEAAYAQHKSALALTPGGGIQAKGFESLGYPDGTLLTSQQQRDLTKELAADRNLDQIVVPEGGSLVNRRTGHVDATGAAKPKTPEAQYIEKAAKALNKKTEDLTQGELGKILGQYQEASADPDVRRMSMQSHELTQAIARLQQNQLPNEVDVETMAKALLDHSLTGAQFGELRSGRAGGVGAKVFTRARQIDPTFSMQKADSEFKAMEATEKNFTSGRQSDLVRSNNNALEHLSMLDQASEALHSGDLQKLNQVAQYLGVQMGVSTKTVYDQIANRVGDEVTKSYIPGGGTAGERTAAGTGGYSSKMSRDQQKANIRADIRLLDSQQRNLVDQYKRGTYGQGGQQLFTDEALAARDRLMGGAPQQQQRGAQGPAPRGPAGMTGATGAQGGGAPALPARLTAADKDKVYTDAAGRRIRITAVNPNNPKEFKSVVLGQ